MAARVKLFESTFAHENATGFSSVALGQLREGHKNSTENELGESTHSSNNGVFGSELL